MLRKRITTFAGIAFAYVSTLTLAIGVAPAQQHPPTTTAISSEINLSVVRKLTDGNFTRKQMLLKFYRSANGDSRLEDGNRVVIVNKSLGQMYQLDMQKQIAWVAVISPKSRPSSMNSGDGLDKLGPPSPQILSSPVSEHQRVINDLGAKTIGTFSVHGTRIVDTTPAHSAMGNDAPIVRTTESWHSDDLRIALLTTIDDPLYGTTTKEFKNIKVNPVLDPSLFQIPSNFQIQSRSTNALTK